MSLYNATVNSQSYNLSFCVNNSLGVTDPLAQSAWRPIVVTINGYSDSSPVTYSMNFFDGTDTQTSAVPIFSHHMLVPKKEFALLGSMTTEDGVQLEITTTVKVN